MLPLQKRAKPSMKKLKLSQGLVRLSTVAILAAILGGCATSSNLGEVKVCENPQLASNNCETPVVPAPRRKRVDMMLMQGDGRI